LPPSRRPRVCEDLYDEHTGPRAAVVMVTDAFGTGATARSPRRRRWRSNIFKARRRSDVRRGPRRHRRLRSHRARRLGRHDAYFRATADVAGQLTAALKVITGKISLQLHRPDDDGGRPEPRERAGHRGMGAPTSVGRVNDVSACGALGGWYYDNNTKAERRSASVPRCAILEDDGGQRRADPLRCPSVPPAIRF